MATNSASVPGIEWAMTASVSPICSYARSGSVAQPRKVGMSPIRENSVERVSPQALSRTAAIW